jgi:hypothetical protein
LRKRTASARFEGGGVKVDGLRKRMAVAHSEARVKVAVCSGASDEATACSRARIEEGRWW